MRTFAMMWRISASPARLHLPLAPGAHAAMATADPASIAADVTVALDSVFSAFPPADTRAADKALSRIAAPPVRLD